MLLSGLLLFLFYPFSGVLAQKAASDISVDFVKTSDSIKANEMYFNVIRVVNRSLKPVIGSIVFSGPENWKILAFPERQTIIQPGDTTLIPIRVSPATDAVGGISYILNGNFVTRDGQYSTNTYLIIPPAEKWDFSTDASKLYFTQTSPNASFRIKLSNKGNTHELIKLDYKIGKLLQFPGTTGSEFVEYVKLPAFHDTIITQTVTYQNKLTYAERMRFENNWRESSINAVASTEKIKRSATISIRKLNSVYLNQRQQSATPLNIDYQVFNLMSNQNPRSNFRLYGSLLFPHNRSFEYLIGAQNLYFNSNSNFNIDRQMIYSLRYNDNRNAIEIGYNINGGSLHSINGRGINGIFKMNSSTQLSYAFTQNLYDGTFGEFAGISTTVKRLAVKAEVVHENTPGNSYNAYSGLFGAGITLFNHHTLSFEVLGSQSKYSLSPGHDTIVLGFSYKLNYFVRYRKFDLRFSGVSSQHNYIRNAGLQQYYLDGRYMVSDNFSVSVYGNRQYYATTHYPYNFFNPVSYNSADFARLTASLTKGNTTFQIGPSYNGSMRQFYNNVSGYRSLYTTYQPGIWSAATFKLPGYGSITPNVNVSNLFFRYNTGDPALQNYNLNKNLYYSVGLNYFDTNWRINAYYTSGSADDLYRSIQIDTNPVSSSSIQFRPSYENFFFNRKLKISAYVNYAYYMPSGRENTSYNLKTDVFLKNGFTFYVSGFMYNNVRVDDNNGRISTKDMNLIVGFTKSFNFQQPRQKYYNLHAVFFNDLDGNHIKTDNEPPVANVLVNIEKDRTKTTGTGSIPEVELLSDENGQIYFENLPKDNYLMTFRPLDNLSGLYFLNGTEQEYYSDKNRTWYIPLAESYKIKGKIILVRDPNSSEGKIDLDGIRITATSPKGETYSVLTDNFGSYLINVPNADKYTVHINNVFGEQFSIDTNETQVQFTGSKTINLDFTFYEKQRGIQFDGKNFFNFNSGDSKTDSAVTVPTSAASTSIVQSQPPASSNSGVADAPNGKMNYAIRLASGNTYHYPSYYQKKFGLKQEVRFAEKDGKYIYYTGVYSTEKQALSALRKSGIKGSVEVVNPIDLKSETTPVPTDRTSSFVSTPKAMPGNLPTTVPSTSPSVIATVPTVGQTQTAASTNTTPGKKGSSPVGQSLKPAENKRLSPAAVTGTTESAPSKDTVALSPVQSYAIQLDTLTTFKDPAVYNDRYNIRQDVTYTAENGKYTYFTGNYPSLKAAQADITRLKLKGFAVKVDQAKLKHGVPAGIKQTYAVQLDALKTFRNPEYYQNKYNLPGKVYYETVDGEYKYYTEGFGALDSARTLKQKYHLNGFVTTVERNKLRSVQSIPSIVSQKQVKIETDETKFVPGKPLTIQIDASRDFVNPESYKMKYGFKGDVYYYQEAGFYRYYYGSYENVDAAKTDIARYGLSGYIVQIDKTLLKK